MFCNACGQQVSEDSGFCSRCGKPLPKYSSPTTRSAASQPAFAGRANSKLGADPKVWVAAVVLLLLLVLVVVSFNTRQLPTAQPQSTAQQQPPAQPSTAQAEMKAEAVTTANRPKTPPPQFRIYRSKLDQGTSIVVLPTTTDEQLKSLLWLLREKIRSHRFKEIGITQPTAKQWGKKGYLSGIISVYRGDKCANEEFADSASPGPCGQGEHDSAVYQWGLLVVSVARC